MKILELKRKEIDHKKFVKRTALESDFQELIKENFILKEDGVIKAVYLNIKENTELVLSALKKISFKTNKRAEGLKSTSRVFGYSPRIPFKNPYCSAALLAVESPQEHKIICDFSKVLSKYYQEQNPQLWLEHDKKAKEIIKPDYLLNNTPFTSGIINKDNQLKYHFDSGNFKNVWSMMIILKKDMQGGYLSLPEFGIGVECSNNSLFLFDGQGILHGVTPFKKLSLDSYRYSIVYYSMQQIWKCLPLTEELAHVRELKAQRELKRTSKNITKTIQEHEKNKERLNETTQI